MTFLDPFRQFLQSLLSQVQSQYYLYVVAALTAVLAFLLMYASGWGAAAYASPWFWPIVILLLALLIILGIRYGTPRLRERSFLRQEELQYFAGNQESPAEFQAKFLNAIDALKNLPQLKSNEGPLYTLPWYLLIGDTKAGKTAALGTVGMFSPLIPLSQDGGGTQNCDWWLSNTSVVLDTSGRYVGQADKAQDRAEWYRLLRLLRRHRSYEPLNGVIVALRADSLISDSKEQLRTLATQLRQRFQEIVEELGCDPPVYILVTHCDLIEGFQEFFTQLPPRVLQEALGYVEEPSPSLSQRSKHTWGDTAVERLRAGLATIYDRLHYIRGSLLDSKASEASRQAIFCFPEEFRALYESVTTFATPLFRFDVNYHTPLLRGIFFCSARQQGTPLSLLRRQFRLGDVATVGPEGKTTYFLSDIFQQLLPRDRGLITITPREQTKRGITRLFGRGSFLAVLGAIALILLGAYREDGRIVSSVNPSTCDFSESASPKPETLTRLNQCRESIVQLGENNRQRPGWLTLWFTSSFAKENELRQHYVANFYTQFLDQVNKNMDLAIRSRDDPVPFILQVARRIQISQRCVSESRCPTELHDEEQPEYALLLALHHKSPPGIQTQEQVMLRSCYIAYLEWQDPAKSIIQQETNDNRLLLQKWLTTGPFTWDRLRDIANRHPVITHERYWERPPPIRVISPARVEAACTKDGWENYMIPLLQPILDAAPDLDDKFRQFRAEHFSRCFEQWQQFLSDFPQGAERWQGTPHDRQTLALRILSEQSPYQRVLAEAWGNIANWLPQDGESQPVPVGLEQLKNFMGSDQRQTYFTELRATAGKLSEASFSETAFTFVKEVVNEDKPLSEATNSFQRAWTIARQIVQESTSAEAKTSGNLLHPLLLEPLRFVWNVLLEHTDIAMRKAWQEEVEKVTPGVSPAERFALLYGPGGKIEAFAKQHEPLLKKKDPFGTKVPLAPVITQSVETQRQLSTFLLPETSHDVKIQTSRRPNITGLSSLLEDETQLSITCGDKIYQVSSRSGQETSMIVPWSYQKCGDVTLIISFALVDRERRAAPPSTADDKPPAPQTSQKIRLTKRYGGPLALLYFLQDVRSGEHSFQMSDFAPDLDANAVLQQELNTVKVYYRVSIPPALEKVTATLQAVAAPERSS